MATKIAKRTAIQVRVQEGALLGALQAFTCGDSQPDLLGVRLLQIPPGKFQHAPSQFVQTWRCRRTFSTRHNEPAPIHWILP